MPDGLSKAEQEKRLAAVAEAKTRAVEEAKQAEIDAKRRAEEDARRAEEKAQREAEEARRAQGKTRKAKANRLPMRPWGGADRSAKPASRRAPEDDKRRQEEKKRPTADKRGGERRRRAGKLTINDALNDEERVRSLASMRRRREREKRQASSQPIAARKYRAPCNCPTPLPFKSWPIAWPSAPSMSLKY